MGHNRRRTLAPPKRDTGVYRAKISIGRDSGPFVSRPSYKQLTPPDESGSPLKAPDARQRISDSEASRISALNQTA
jgi:hypothetical protein